jgi:hypothetical protein
MKPPPIDTAQDPDLRHSLQALVRASERAREIAAQTGTFIVISVQGELVLLDPAALTSNKRSAGNQD